MFKKQLTCLLAALSLTLSLVPAALAVQSDTAVPDGAPTDEAVSVHAQVWGDRIYVETELTAFWDGQGYRRTPLAYNGTVYIPLRTTGLWMGADVTWEQDSLTAAFTTGRRPAAYPGNGPASFEQPPTEEMRAAQILALSEGVTAQLRPDISVTVDGVEQIFTNVNGQRVYPLLYEECLYLPVRSIGQLCGKAVLWYPVEPGVSHIYLYDAPTPQQTAEGEAFLQGAESDLAGLRAGLAKLRTRTDLTDPSFQAEVAALRETASTLSARPLPTCGPMAVGAKAVTGGASDLIRDVLDPYLQPDTLLRPDFAAGGWQTWQAPFAAAMDAALAQLDSALTWTRDMQDLTAAE